VREAAEPGTALRAPRSWLMLVVEETKSIVEKAQAFAPLSMAVRDASTLTSPTPITLWP
jgi:hypothetical protein